MCMSARVALVAESWFTPKHLDADIAIDGYVLFRRDRIRRRGGGVCAYVDAQLACEFYHPGVNDDNIEIMWLMYES